MPRPKTASQSNRAYAPHTLTFSTHLRKPRKHTFHAALFSISPVHRPQIRSKPVEFLPPSKNPPRPSNLAPSLILNPNRSRNHIWSKLGYDDPHRSHLTLPFLLLFSLLPRTLCTSRRYDHGILSRLTTPSSGLVTNNRVTHILTQRIYAGRWRTVRGYF